MARPQGRCARIWMSAQRYKNYYFWSNGEILKVGKNGLAGGATVFSLTLSLLLLRQKMELQLWLRAGLWLPRQSQVACSRRQHCARLRSTGPPCCRHPLLPGAVEGFHGLARAAMGLPIGALADSKAAESWWVFR